MFEKHFDVDASHIDFQGIVDGLFYPFYLEWTRHAFMRDVVGIDIEQAVKDGYLYVLSEYSLKFKKPLKMGDKLTVTCELVPNEKSSRFNFKQTIMVDGKVHAEAEFVATCILPSGRPGVPDGVKALLTPAVTSL